MDELSDHSGLIRIIKNDLKDPLGGPLAPFLYIRAISRTFGRIPPEFLGGESEEDDFWNI